MPSPCPQALENPALDFGEVDHRLAGGVLQPDDIQSLDVPGGDVLGEWQRRAQPGSSSSFRPCGVASPFSVTTQVLLRSVVESSHWPTMSFFKVAASCVHAGDPQTTDANSAASTMPSATASHQRPFTGVSATGVSGGLPANQAFRLSTTS